MSKRTWAWAKVPSAIVSEKPYFWYSAQPTRIWILWDQQLGCWTIRLDGGAIITQMAFTPAKAKRLIRERGL